MLFQLVFVPGKTDEDGEVHDTASGNVLPPYVSKVFALRISILAGKGAGIKSGVSIKQ